MLIYPLILVLVTCINLFAVSTHRKTYAHRYEIRSLFSNTKSIKDSIEADLLLQTKIPTVNLINFDSIKIVTCTRDHLEIVFDRLDSATTALNEWSKTTTLAMIAAPRHNCNGANIGFMRVKDLALKGKTLKAIQIPLPPNEVISFYKLNVCQSSNSRLNKRTGMTTSIPLNLNYDGHSVIKKSIGLYNSTSDSGQCIDCHVKGNVTFKTTIGGSLDQVQSLRMAIEGEFTVHLGLKLDIQTSLRRRVGTFTLPHSILNPINIGGLFKLGPQLSIDLELSVAATIGTAVEVEMGSEITYPINFVIDSFHDKTPQVQYSGTPTVVPLPVKLTSGTVSLLAFLGPKVSFGFKVFNQGVDVALKLGTEVGVEMNSSGCEGVPLDIQVYQKALFRAEVTVFSLTWYHDILTTGKNLILCAFCNKCPKKIDSSV